MARYPRIRRLTIAGLSCPGRAHDARRRQHEWPAGHDFVTAAPALRRLFHRESHGRCRPSARPCGEARPANEGAVSRPGVLTMNAEEVRIPGAMKCEEEPLARRLLTRHRLPRAARCGRRQPMASRRLDGDVRATLSQSVKQFSNGRAVVNTDLARGCDRATATDVSAGVGGGFALIRPDILAPLKRANPVKAGDAKSTV